MRIHTSLSVSANHKEPVLGHSLLAVGESSMHPAQQRVNFPMAIAPSSHQRCAFAGFDSRRGWGYDVM